MKRTIIFKIYLAITIGFYIASIVFINFVAYNPIENAIFWTSSALGFINITFFLTLVLGYLIINLLKRQLLRINLITNILIGVLLIITSLMSFYTSYNSQEVFWVSYGSFIREHGYLVGFVMALMMINITTSFFLNKNLGNRKFNSRFTLLSIVSLGIFISLYFYLLQNGILLVSFLLIIVSSLLLLSSFFYYITSRHTIIIRDQLDFKTRKHIFNFSIIWFLIFFILGILYLLRGFDHLLIFNQRMTYPINIAEIIIVIFEVLYLISFFVFTRIQSKDGVVISIKSILEFVGVLLAIYYFANVVLVSSFLIKEGIFIGVGSLVYILVMRYFGNKVGEEALSNYIRMSSTILLVILLIILGISNSTLDHVDQFVNSSFVNNMALIHSPLHLILSSFSVGLILSDVIYKFKFQSNQQVIDHSFFFSFSLYYIGIFIVVICSEVFSFQASGFWPANLELLPQDHNGATITIIFSVILLLVGVITFLIHLFKKKHYFEEPNADIHLEFKMHKRYTVLIPLVYSLILVFIIISINLTTTKSGFINDKQGYILVTDSYDKIAPKAYINRNSIKIDNSYTIDVAKQEYGSLQLVINPNSNIYQLSSSISIEDESGNVIQDYELYVSQNLYNDSYSEILTPIQEFNSPIKGNQNTTLWFGFFTSSDQVNGTYKAKITLEYIQKEHLVQRNIIFYINVSNWALPSDYSVFYNLPFIETKGTTEFYSKYHQSLDGGALLGSLTNHSLYLGDDAAFENGIYQSGKYINGIYTGGPFDYYTDISSNVKKEELLTWGYSVSSYDDIRKYASTILSSYIENDILSMFRIENYYSVMLNKNQGINNPSNFNNDKFTGLDWYGNEWKEVYSYYYELNYYLLSYEVKDKTLADYCVVKYKDEFDNFQFFPKTHNGKQISRQDTYNIYKLELSLIQKAKHDSSYNYFKELYPTYSTEQINELASIHGFILAANVDPLEPTLKNTLYEFIDLFIVISPKIDDKLVSTLYNDDKLLWQYTCVQPFAPYPNQFAYNSLVETHITQWQNYRYHLTGYWLWKSDCNDNNGFGYGYNGYLDGVFVYYDENQRPSVSQLNSLEFNIGIRFLVACESIEETQLFYYLESLLTEYDSKLSLEDSKLKAKLDELITEVISSMSKYQKDKKVLRETISWVRNTISYLQDKYSSI